MKATPLASYVVDTNVAIVANKAADVDVCCERACIDELQRVAERCIVVVDEGLLILEEYRKRLTPGRSGVGNVLARFVYARSVNAPSTAKWMAMVKKHHAWKVTEPGTLLYGEDIYGVHSIEYGPVPENETFYAFALRDGQGLFSSFGFLADYASQRDIPVVPVLFAGTFHTEDDLRDFIHSSHAQASALGGEREGVVIRLARSFPASEFSNCVCKSVRARHVQTDHHWTQHWRPCRIVRPG